MRNKWEVKLYHMPLQARIILKAGNDSTGGGVLIVDGGTITTSCPGLWKGLAFNLTQLTRGIYATNAAGSVGIDLSKTLFLDNTYGAYFSGFTSVSGLRILSNTFRNGQPCPTDSYGLYLDQCTGYHVEDNEFYQTDSSLKGIGLVVNNSGILANEIYRNQFHNLRFATLSQNVNRNDDETYDATGLCYKCNKMVKDDLTEPNLFDFAITYDQSYSDYIGIARYQGTYLSGSNFAPVGNMFKPYPDYPHYDFANEGNDIDYYYHSQNLTYFRLQPQPQYIYGTVRSHSVVAQFSESSCPSTLSGGGASEDLDLLVESLNQSDSISDVLTTVVDGGSTELLTFDVQTSTPPEAMQLRNELLTESPYLSDTVLKTSVSKEEVLNNALIRDVLVANPHSAKSEKINEMLANRTIPMPDYMMEQILAGEDSIGPKELLQARKAWWEQEATKSYTHLIHHYQGNGIDTVKTDSLNWLFAYRNTSSSNYDKPDWLHAQSDYDQMEAVMNTIPAIFNLTGPQTSTHQAYLDFYELSETIRSDTTLVFRVDSATAASFQAITNANNELPGVYSRNILLAAGKINYQEPIILPDTGLKVVKKEKFKGVKETGYSKLISVFPNPAHDYFILKLNLSENTEQRVIKLYDVNGKVLRSFEVHSQKDQIVVPTTNLKSGIYLLEIDINGEKLSNVKIAIIR